MTQFDIHTIESAPEASRDLLEDSRKAFGRVPGLHAVMAQAPALLDGYKHLHKLFSQQTSFDNDELTVVWQTINVEHACHYCVPAHTGIAKMMKVDDAITNALRDETPLPTPRLEALRTFTLEMIRSRGNLSNDQVKAFLDAGYTQRHVLEVILGLSQKVMSNTPTILPRRQWTNSCKSLRGRSPNSPRSGIATRKRQGSCPSASRVQPPGFCRPPWWANRRPFHIFDFTPTQGGSQCSRSTTRAHPTA